MLTKLCGPERDLELGLLVRTTSSTSIPQNTIDHTPTSTPISDRNQDRSQLIIGDALELFSKHLRGHN